MIAAAALMLAPLAAHAQPKEQLIYRCTGKDGKKYYGQTVPQACLGLPLELINKQGLVVKRIDFEGDEKARIAKEEEAQKKRGMDAAQKEALRRNHALLATYTSEKDIEEARRRALVEHQKQVRDIEVKMAEMQRSKTRYQKEFDLFVKEAKGKPPVRLREEIDNAEFELRVQGGLLGAKKKEVEGINARYDDDRRRYKEATTRK
jgi:hypothetical protein